MNWQQFKSRIKIGFTRFMYGRNGIDQLSVFILFISMLISVLAIIFKLPGLQLVYYAGVTFVFYRILSKSIFKRRSENQKFLQQLRKVKSWSMVQKQIFGERKTHRHFKCPNCGQRLRVPKGRGKITVTCSKCGEKFSRKS